MKVYTIILNDYGCDSKTLVTDIERTTGELALAINKDVCLYIGCENGGHKISEDDLANIKMDVLITYKHSGVLYITKNIESRNKLLSLIIKNINDEVFPHVLDDLCGMSYVQPLFEV